MEGRLSKVAGWLVGCFLNVNNDVFIEVLVRRPELLRLIMLFTFYRLSDVAL